MPEWQRHGYATEMTDAWVKRVLSMAGVARVIAHTTQGNPASIAVLGRCGFVETSQGMTPAPFALNALMPAP